MRHEESNLQQQCVAWFRAQYPQYAMLLTHVPNEGNGNRVSGAIHKAEGTVAGVPDLLLFLPSWYPEKGKDDATVWCLVHGLGIEMKSEKGKVRQSQKDFKKMFEAAGYRYEIVRSLDEFKTLIKSYITFVHHALAYEIGMAHKAIKEAAEQREREHFYKVIGKQP